MSSSASQLVKPVPEHLPTFAGAPRVESLIDLDADIAIIGVPFGWPASADGERAPSSAAPSSIRAQSQRYARFRGHHDFDFNGDILAGRDVRIVDCGDVRAVTGEHAANSARTTTAIVKILERGATPYVLGGDHSIPIPVFRGFGASEPFCIVQIDAHLDFRDEVNGVNDGLSSNMRRASELPWVSGIAAVGLRGIGSARPADVADALAWGAMHIPARDVHRHGIDAVLDRIPTAARYYITLDIDGLDPAVAPGVLAPAFGGVTYQQTFDLIRGVAAKGKIVGFDVCEVVPELDIRDLTSILAARFVMAAIGASTWSGQLGSRP